MQTCQLLLCFLLVWERPSSTFPVACTPSWLSRWLSLDDVEYRSLRHPESVLEGSFWMTEVILVNLKPPFFCVATMKLRWFIYNSFLSTVVVKVGNINLVSLESTSSQLVVSLDCCLLLCFQLISWNFCLSWPGAWYIAGENLFNGRKGWEVKASLWVSTV